MNPILANKKLLITGGTGSFGTAVLDKYLSSDISEIRILSRDEKKQYDMRLKYKDDRIKFYVGDVRDYDSVLYAMTGVDYVFHAAALKQVPSCEFYPLEAVKTNILGAENVLKAALRLKIGKVIVLSTDKAVYPINAMGMSKALMEKVMVAMSRNIIDVKQVFAGTRYGNVMGSRGSVIPRFINQALNNKPLTITDPKMTRFMMSLDDAIELVMFAFENSSPGDIFVQKAPSCTIEDLAIAIKEILNASSKIEIIGTRHGEKLHETLLSREEMVRSEDLGQYYKISPDSRNLNYDHFFSKGIKKISTGKDYKSNDTKILNVSEMKELLLKQDFIKRALK